MNRAIGIRQPHSCPMENHVVSASRSAMQVANPRLLALITESIENEPRYVDVNRIETRGPQGDRLRLHIEYLNPASAPFGDAMKAALEPGSPALNAVWATKMHRY